MTGTFQSMAVHAYGIATLAYLAHLVSPLGLLAQTGRLLSAVGLVLHGAGLALLLGGQAGVPIGGWQALSCLAFLLAALLVGLDWRHRLPVLGAFLSPLVLALAVPASLLRGDGSGPAPVDPGPWLPIHVSSALIGLASLAVATAVAILYLLQERQMKGKRFGLLFSRLPPLQLLDDLGRRLVTAGFVSLSVAGVLGAVLIGHGFQWTPKEVATLGGWAVFALVLGSRLLIGWRGRRAAVLTMAGFCLLIVSFLSAFGPFTPMTTLAVGGS